MKRNLTKKNQNMKKLIVLNILLMFALFVQADNIPENVKEYVSKNYPKAKNIEWNKGSKDTYKAEFYINGLKTELEITSSGELSYSNEKIFNKDFPDFINTYVKNNFPDAEIQEGTKIVKGQTVTYNIEIVTVDKKGKMNNKTLSFDDKGNIKK